MENLYHPNMHGIYLADDKPFAERMYLRIDDLLEANDASEYATCYEVWSKGEFLASFPIDFTRG